MDSEWRPLRIVPARLPGGDREGLLAGAGRRFHHATDGTAIEFEWEAFNRIYDVYCLDRTFAHAFVDARMMEALMKDPGAFAAQVGGPWLMVYATQQDLASRGAMLDALARVADAVPDLVR
jgi:uncharacterized protein YjhX (UPF0386 family)